MQFKKSHLTKLIFSFFILLNAQTTFALVDCDSIWKADLKQCHEIFDDWSCGISIICREQKVSFLEQCFVDALHDLNICYKKQEEYINNKLETTIMLNERAAQDWEETAEIYRSMRSDN